MWLSVRLDQVLLLPRLHFLFLLLPNRFLALVHIVEDLANNQLLHLWDKKLAELARVDVTQEVVRTNLSCLTLKKHLDDFEGGLFENYYIFCLVFGKLESIDKVLEG